MTSKQTNGHCKEMLVFRRVKDPTEIVECFRENGEAWRGKLSLEDYIGREMHIGAQAGTYGTALSYWVLVDEKNNIVSACETLRRPAIRTELGSDGTVKLSHVRCYTLSVVFTPPRYRGKGYAKVMLAELNKKLDDEIEKPGEFSILYTEVGFAYYQAFGYEIVQDPDYDYIFTVNDDDACQSEENNQLFDKTGLRYVCSGSDLDQLLQDDLDMMIEYLKASTLKDGKTRVAVEPHTNTVGLLHARASYVRSKLRPSAVGPFRIGAQAGNMYIVWMQDYDKDLLNILRLGQTTKSSKNDSSSDRIMQLDALLAAAKQEAAHCNFTKIVLWGPEAPKWMTNHLSEKGGGYCQKRSSSQAMIRDYRGQHEHQIIWEFCGKYAWF